MTRNKLRVNIYSRGEDVKVYSSREVIKMLKENGWYEVSCSGDHHQFKHNIIKGKVTVRHPVKDLHINDLKSIEKQSGLKFK